MFAVVVAFSAGRQSQMYHTHQAFHRVAAAYLNPRLRIFYSLIPMICLAGASWLANSWWLRGIEVLLCVFGFFCGCARADSQARKMIVKSLERGGMDEAAARQEAARIVESNRLRPRR